MSRRFSSSMLVGLLVVACSGDDPPPPGSDLPESFEIGAAGVSVTIQRAPYGYSVRTEAGADPVLTTLAEPRPDAEGNAAGWAPLAWTTGSTRWSSMPAVQGHFRFSPTFDPWREGWTVVEAPMVTPTVVELVLRGEGGHGADRVVVRHEVRGSTLRVEARLEPADGALVPRAWSAAFVSPDPTEGFLGFGERFNRTNQRGVAVYNWAEEGGFGTGEGTLAGPRNPAPNGEAMSYYPVPFFVSTKHYGFWLDTTWRSQFDLATDHADAWRVWHIGPSLAYEVFLPIPGDERGAPDQLVDLFTARTGRPMLPPAWAYGPRRRINLDDVQMGVPEIQAMRDLDLAITGVDDSVHFLPNGAHVGREETLRAWVASGHALGYRMLGYYNSLLANREGSPIYAEVERALENRWVLFEERGRPSEVGLISGDLLPVLHVDVTLPEAADFFGSMFDWALELGYDGWMQDFGEWVQWDVLAANGMGGEELHNLYPVLYHRAVYEHLESGPRAGDWVGFVRSGYTGSSQYTPLTWSGDPAASFEDSDGLPSMIRAAINMGISGAPNWGGDIGGFHCLADGHAAADGELVTRWIEQGSMNPSMMDQDSCSGALDEGEKASIWSSPDAMEAWRVYARLHTRLFPYFFTLGHQAHETGRPIVRHYFFEHPDRVDLASVDDAHYLGGALLVAPVIERGARTRTVTLPPGEFVDWRDGTVHRGDREVTVDAPLRELPLFLRAGHLVPLLDPTIDTLDDRETSPEVIGPADVDDVYDVVAVVSAASPRATFTLWDGTAFAVERTAAPAMPRVQVEATGDTTAPGLTLSSTSTRRIRWDVYVID